LQADGSTLRAQLYRMDTGLYLNSRGQWQSAPTWALTASDSVIRSAGQVGLARPASYPGIAAFDDFTLADFKGPTVSIAGLTSGATISSPIAVTANTADSAAISRVDFYVDGVRQGTDTVAPYSWILDPSVLRVGTHTLTVNVFDVANNTSSATLLFSTRAPASGGTGISIPQHYSWIRIAELAYSGTPIGAFEQQLLKNSVDLVIPNSNYLSVINAIAPRTPQLIYTNTSTLYQNLLTDWLNYADAHGVSREAAFLHVTQPTHYSGSSSSSQPVNWFWAVYLGGATPNYVDLTSSAHDRSSGTTFGDYGQSIYLGYPDEFREINISLASAAAAGWSAVLEYPTAVDAFGNPTAWATLQTITNTTNGFTRSGQITFDPPSNWKTANLNGGPRLYYVRIRTVSGGRDPVAYTILGRDYTNSHGTNSGVVPAFDYAADRNHDGYLNNAEYAVAVAHGMTARFVYESRLFTQYGPMRPATNPSNTAFQNWAVNFSVRQLQSQRLADGFFVDNSGGNPPVPQSEVRESLANYSSAYGAMLGAISKAIAPRFIVANTSGGQTDADTVVMDAAGYFEEFALRPLATNYQQFQDLAALIAHRQNLKTPTPYAVLDSLPTGGSPTDSRTQLATLAYYYLLADPKATFLDFYGGYSPATSWTQHWSQAVTYNVGQPLGTWSLFTTGADPSNRNLTYQIYQRSYTNALILYKPLSYGAGGRTGTLASNTATTTRLNGTYRPLNANGTLGSPITSIKLMNGQGAILIKV
jgi:hypothetical protein